MRALIVANGEVAGWKAVPEDRFAAPLVIAVDGGWVHCSTLGLHANVIIGDLDSLTKQDLDNAQSQSVQLLQDSPDKDETDLELALLYAVQNGANEVTILAGLGGRMDMSVANITLMVHPQLESVRIEFWHRGQRVWLIQPPGDVIAGQPGDTLSLLPFAGDAYGVRTENLAYPLENGHLQLGLTRGISNVLTSDRATVTLERGRLLAVWTRGRA